MLVDALHGARRLAVHRLAGDRRATAPTSATRSSRSSTRASGRCRSRRTAACRASRRAGSGRWSGRMLRPDLFGAFATHAGDALFEVSLARELRARGAGAAELLRRLVRRASGPTSAPAGPCSRSRTDHVLLDGLRVCGRLLARTPTARSTCPSGSTPASSCPRCGSAGSRGTRCGWRPRTPRRCAAARGIWIDAGRNDEYHLDLGAVAFREAVAAAGVAEDVVRFELFEGTHRGMTWRYPLSLRSSPSGCLPKRTVGGAAGRRALARRSEPSGASSRPGAARTRRRAPARLLGGRPAA